VCASSKAARPHAQHILCISKICIKLLQYFQTLDRILLDWDQGVFASCRKRLQRRVSLGPKCILLEMPGAFLNVCSTSQRYLCHAGGYSRWSIFPTEDFVASLIRHPVSTANEDVMNLVMFYQSNNLCRLKTVACLAESRH